MTTRIEIIFSDLDETLAATITDAIAETLANDEQLTLLMTHKSVPRTFEVKLNDPALPNINGQTYEITTGDPAHVRMTALGGGTGGGNT